MAKLPLILIPSSGILDTNSRYQFALDICGRIVVAREMNLSVRISDNAVTHEFRVFPYQIEITRVSQISRSRHVVIVIPILLIVVAYRNN